MLSNKFLSPIPIHTVICMCYVGVMSYKHMHLPWECECLKPLEGNVGAPALVSLQCFLQAVNMHAYRNHPRGHTSTLRWGHICCSQGSLSLLGTGPLGRLARWLGGSSLWPRQSGGAGGVTWRHQTRFQLLLWYPLLSPPSYRCSSFFYASNQVESVFFPLFSLA